jgi:predicted amidohydrolase YtcJ
MRPFEEASHQKGSKGTVSRPADLIFRGGAVYTVDPLRPRAESVAVLDGKILAVGSDKELRGLAGPNTTVFDLEGRMLLPGFQDAHVHPPSAGVQRLRCNLDAAEDRGGYLSAVKAYALANPDEPWIRGGGWSMAAFPGGTPLKEDLDAVVPDRPVFLTNRDGHGAWVNSRALELAGITAATPDPSHGRIERAPDGSPTGTLHEGSMDLVVTLLPGLTQDELLAGLLEGQAYLHSLGITAWQDAIVEEEQWGRSLDTYVAAAQRRELTARVVGALWWRRDEGLEQVQRLAALRDRGRAGRFAATSVKIMQDGVLENFTGALIEPYLDPCTAGDCGHDPANRGISMVEPELLHEAVPALDAAGFQVHFHAIGDRAVREALDALETARTANGHNDHRHHIAHIQVVHPDDVGRFATLDVTANGQPLWAAYDDQMVELTIPFLGPERTAWQYPFASLKRAGARLAFGSDWSVSTPDPMEEMSVAVNRSLHPAAGETNPKAADPFLPDERLTLAEAIEAFTMGTAYVNHLDDVTGSIEVGKYADLAVVDRDLFSVDPGSIHEAAVVMTLVEGELVYSADEVPGS